MAVAYPHARLASGCRPGSTRRDSHPQGLCERFPSQSLFPLSQAFLAQDTIFSSKGSSIKVANGTASDGLFKGRGIAEITDGTSNTIAIVPVDPSKKIPWTKPEDITVGPDFPGLGKPGGIFTPARFDGVGAAPILIADGSVRVLSEKSDPATIRAMTTIRGGEIIDMSKLISPAGGLRRTSARPQVASSLYRLASLSPRSAKSSGVG